MARPKKPIAATMHAVRITREGEHANIDYKNPAISGVSLKIGPGINEMTDQDILDLHNRIIWQKETGSSHKSVHSLRHWQVTHAEVQVSDKGS